MAYKGYKKKIDYKTFEWSKILGKPLGTPRNESNDFFKLNSSGINNPIVIEEIDDFLLLLSSVPVEGRNPITKDQATNKYAEGFLDSKRAVLVEEYEAMPFYMSKDYGRGYKMPMFYGDSFVDTSVVFMMKKEDFLDNIELRTDFLEITRNINLIDKIKVLKSVVSNFIDDHISIVEGKIEEDLGTVGKSKRLLIDTERLEKQTQDELDKKENYDLADSDIDLKALTNRLLHIIQECLYRAQMQIGCLEWYRVADLQYYFAFVEPTLSHINESTGINKDLNHEQLGEEDIQIECKKDSLSDFERKYYEEHPDLFKENFKTNFDKYHDYKREHKEDI